MALPLLPEPPTVPSQYQPRGEFNANVAGYLTWMVLWANAIQVWSAALNAEVDDAIAAAVAAYDPTGNYSAVQVNALLRQRADEAYFLAMTS